MKQRVDGWMMALMRLGVRAAIVGLILCMTIGWAGRLWAPLDLLVHFQPQYLACGVLLGLAAVLVRSRKWAAVTLVPIVAAGLMIAPWMIGSPVNVDGAKHETTVLLANVRRGSGAFSDIAAMLDHYDADIVVLQEIDDVWLSELDAARRRYAYEIAAPSSTGNFGLVVWSRLPMTGIAEHTADAVRTHYPTVFAEIMFDDALMTLIATHPPPPMGLRATAVRDAQMAAIAERVNASDHPVLLAGDLNASMWSRPYCQFIEATGLENARQTARFVSGSSPGRIIPTWHARLPWMFRIPIDHILHDTSIGVESIERTPRGRSDHFGLFARIRR